MDSMSKTVIAGWIIELAGTALWIYGYFATGNPSLINWQTITPWWIANFLPNIQAEIGVVLVLIAMIPLYWPRRR
jgi:hypothetical protein